MVQVGKNGLHSIGEDKFSPTYRLRIECRQGGYLEALKDLYSKLKLDEDKTYSTQEIRQAVDQLESDCHKDFGR